MKRSRRDALQAIVPLVQRGIVTTGDVEEFESLYAEVWGGHGTSIGQACGFGPWARTTHVSPEWADTHARLRHEDPSESILRAAPEGVPFITSWIWNAAARRTEIYREFIAHGYADSMVQRFSSPHLGDMFAVVHRLKGAPRFTKADADLAQLLHSHLAGALVTQSAMRALSLEGARAPLAHAHVSFPSMDVHMDPRSRQVWPRILGEPVGARGITRIERMIRRIALDFVRGAPGSRTRWILPALRAEAAWVPAKARETHRALVLFFDAPQRPARSLTAPATELLSPAQRRVAELAASGMSNVEIASALGLSIETVRTYLREAMRRLGVSRRMELVAFTEP